MLEQVKLYVGSVLSILSEGGELFACHCPVASAQTSQGEAESAMLQWGLRVMPTGEGYDKHDVQLFEVYEAFLDTHMPELKTFIRKVKMGEVNDAATVES